MGISSGLVAVHAVFAAQRGGLYVVVLIPFNFGCLKCQPQLHPVSPCLPVEKRRAVHPPRMSKFRPTPHAPVLLVRRSPLPPKSCNQQNQTTQFELIVGKSFILSFILLTASDRHETEVDILSLRRQHAALLESSHHQSWHSLFSFCGHSRSLSLARALFFFPLST